MIPSNALPDDVSEVSPPSSLLTIWRLPTVKTPGPTIASSRSVDVENFKRPQLDYLGLYHGVFIYKILSSTVSIR